MLQGPWAKWSILESIVGGAVVVISTWYLHRGFLLSNFPQIAADLQPAGSGLTVRLLILSIASLVAATAISHLFDFVIPAVIGRKKYIDKRYAFLKSVAVFATRLVTFTPEADPRITALKRYLEPTSNRREWVLSMVRDWAKVPNLDPNDEEELIRVHQHLVTRLRVISDSSRALIQQTYTEVVFAGSMFIAWLILLPIAFVSLFTQTEARSLSFQLMLIGLIYSCAVVWGFLFRRRFRIFFSQVVTIALHYYEIENAKRGLKDGTPPIATPSL